MNILIIQMLRLGDAVQMIPIIRGLKNQFPSCRISVLTSLVGKGVFEMDPAVHCVYVMDKQTIARLTGRGRKSDILAALKIVNAELEPILAVKWDWVVNFSFSYPSALLSFLLNADRRSGFVVNGHRQYLSRERWFAHSLASFTHRKYSNFNWVDINRKIIGLSSVPEHPLLQPSPEALEKASLHLRSIGFEEKSIVGINPGASGVHKMWPVEKFARLGRRLVDKHDFRVLVFGGKGETVLGHALKGFIGDKAEDLTGRTTLDQLAAFLSHCHVLVTNDTGPMHLAYSVGTRVISLFFNSHFVETGPYGKGHVAVHPAIPCFPCQGQARCDNKICLSSISPETIEGIVLNRSMPGQNYSDGDSAQAHVADFDPWGVLEWFPLQPPPLSMPILEKLLLRAAWLSHCDMIPENGEVDCLERSLERYSPPEDANAFISMVAELVDSLSDFTAKLKLAYGYASQIHMAATNPRPDISLINSLGARLGLTEREALVFEGHSSVSFIGELLKVFLENIELSHLADLSRNTIAAYHEIMQFTDLMLAGAKKVKASLSS